MSGPTFGRTGGHNADSRFEAIRDLYRDALHQEYARGVERGYDGTTWHLKPDGWQCNYAPMSFSTALLDVAGGLKGLAEAWEMEP